MISVKRFSETNNFKKKLVKNLYTMQGFRNYNMDAMQHREQPISMDLLNAHPYNSKSSPPLSPLSGKFSVITFEQNPHKFECPIQYNFKIKIIS